MQGNSEGINLKDITLAGAENFEFYGKYFFPRAFRQGSAPFHRRIANEIDNPENRENSILVFRGGAKTTTCRVLASRRIAYGTSHNILYLGKSKDHAVRSVTWLKEAVEGNKRWTNHFGLGKGSVWTSEHIMVKHNIEGYEVSVLALGIDGSIRGINEMDFRPDFIIADDIVDETNSVTPEARKNINERFFGAVMNTLAPKSEAPNATVALLQTPIAQGDLADITQKDSTWNRVCLGCFDEEGNSRWEERIPTNELLKQKQSAIDRNMLSVFLREMECKIVGDESRYFRESWLRKHLEVPEPKYCVTCIAIDPSPPKDEEPEKRLKKDPDPEVLAVVGYHKGEPWIFEWVKIRKPNPDITWAELQRLRLKWHPVTVGSETVAYQSTLRWYLQKKQNQEGCIFPIQKYDDKRPKTKRIRQNFADFALTGLNVPYECEEFLNEFRDYPDVLHDDILDACAIGFELLERHTGGNMGEGNNEDHIPDISEVIGEDFRGAP